MISPIPVSDWQYRCGDTEHKECDMDWTNAEENWKHFSTKLKSRWGKLSDQNLALVAGKREALLTTLQKLYDMSPEEADKQVKSFEDHTKNFVPKPAV
jgi:uncharacterized protein YjbJ (UPF0337 family)